MKRERLFVSVVLLSLLFTGCTRPEASLPPASPSHPAVATLQDWCKTAQPGITSDWNKAETTLATKQECGSELGSLMKGMEFLQVTLAGNLQNLNGAQQCWRVSVPVQDKLTGYAARAMVGCLDTNDNRVLAVYALPKR